MDNIFVIKTQISSLLLLKNDYELILKKIKTAQDAPAFNAQTRKIYIFEGEFWNQVYQLSHELLHVAFYECNGENKSEHQWIEEIICEAFSIYCLKRYCKNEYSLWKIYLYPYMYYRNGNCTTREIISSECITTTNDLNNRLLDYKSYEIWQFIHLLCLLILCVIDANIR